MDGIAANWTTQLRKGVLELAILNALADHPRYGYDLVRRLRPIDGLVVSEGTIYPLLNRLKRDGLVASSLEESPDGPPRKYYRLSPRGQRQLELMNRHWQRLTRGIEDLRKENGS